MGEIMNQFKQPLLTIFVIFATAYVLTIVGCTPPSAESRSAPVPVGSNNSPTEHAVLTAIPLSDLRECTQEEFSKLVRWSDSLASAVSSINDLGNSAKWKKDANVIKTATEVINQCDALTYYHSLKPCKKTTANIITPTKPTVKGYDAFRITERCDLPNQYLTKFNLRPDPNNIVKAPPVPVKPPVVPTPQPPVTAPNEQPPVVIDPVPDNSINGLRQCSVDEFEKIKTWKAALDQANKNIAKLGSQANWKYESNAISSAATATKSCEALMNYHQANECQRKIVDDKTKTSQIKTYSREIIRDLCQSTRLYNYEFAQHAESLIVAGASLFFDASPLANQTIEAGSVDSRIGDQCLVSNLTASDVSYSPGQQVLLTAARVYPPQNSDNGGLQMFVFETEQGLKVECYGLDYPGVKTSKAEVERLLKQKNTDINLHYELGQ